MIAQSSAARAARWLRPAAALAFLGILLMALPLSAQGPAAGWMTIETAHFRVHYPREYEAWALRAASRLESIREAVSEEVGFSPPQTIDVLIVNPIAQANGSAWPLLDTPRMIFYTEPPGPEEQIGAYGHWIDLLAVHETAHLVHMLRPSRNPLTRLVERFGIPLNPITLRSPRWVLEGYATVIEGKLTGAGRPTSTIRALILRRWAESGRLPTYGQLNSDQRFLGMSMAYLMGSAFLEWLEQERGPESLRNLWARMTARQRRSFDEAFIGVFGDRPDRLYGRFIAELTASAIAIDRAGSYQEGELFQRTPRNSGDPAVAPDGSKLAIVLRQREKPPRLVIWSTAAPEEETKKFDERLAKILERDPEDVAPVREQPLPRKEQHSLVMPDGGDIEQPRWMPDGERILFAHRMPDAEGFLHYDLFLWTPSAGELRRVTHLADVRSADPLPDGNTAVAIRSRYGASELVTVQLERGTVVPRTEASIETVYTNPRVSPDGARVAYVAHRGGLWRLFVDERELAVPGDPASPVWLSNEELLVTLYARGFAEVHRVRVEEGTAEPVTRARGGAFQAAPSPDGRLFFMSLDPDGYVVRMIDAPGVAPPLPVTDSSLVPAVPPAPPAGVAAFAEEAVSPRPYGIGRQEPAWLMSQSLATGHRAAEVGVRFGDVVGRLDTLFLAAYGSGEAPQGGAVATAWRGWPVAAHAHLFGTREHDSGIELRGVWTRRFPRSRLAIEAGGLSSDPLVFASAAFSTWQRLGTARFEQAARLERIDRQTRATAVASFRGGTLRVAARYDLERGDPVTLGGLASSILPRSAYAGRVLDPALPVGILSGDDYDGLRIEANLPGLPFTAFYQRHEIGGGALSLAGGELVWSMAPNPILKMPGLDLTLGAARILDGPLRNENKGWLGMRWRP